MNNTIDLNTIRDTASSVINRTSSMLSKISATIPKMLNQHGDDCGCGCQPKHECPPQCILPIRRTAYVGERIIVPFKIKNTHSTTKTYQIGHWPLMDENGNTAPAQPIFNKSSVTLAPNQTVIVGMSIDLVAFQQGHTYNMEIVLRESKFNQNICFTLHMTDFTNAPVAKPWDENSVYPKFLDWQTHFTCPTK